MSDDPIVFIHTNDKQIVGALLGAYSMKHASKTPDAFDVRLVRLERTPHLLKRQGQTYKRKGKPAVWHNEDLQSFSPLRRMVPQLTGFKGRAVVVDPDVFAVGDIYELLSMDMADKAIFCRHIVEGYKGGGNSFYASSVMLLDCAKLKHWRWDDDIDAMFEGRLDYGPWIGLTTEDPATIGEVGEEWNSFDKLTTETQLLHSTERSTQPWKAGLPIDFDLNITKGDKPKTVTRSSSFLAQVLAQLRPPEVSADTPKYERHPDRLVECFFFKLLRDALEDGAISEEFLRRQMAANDVRHDAFEMLDHVGYRGPSAHDSPGRLIECYSL